jgi:hypothetical protein
VKVYDWGYPLFPFFFEGHDKQNHASTETKKTDASIQIKENNASTETKKSTA